MVRLQVDGREVEVELGTTVKGAAEAAGIRIPGLCDHPDLLPYGGCRLCIVEVEGLRGYPSSCTLPAAEGMKVTTENPVLKDMRREILGMLLSEHPSICLTCQRAGRCDQFRQPLRKVPQSMGCRYCPADGRCELQEVVEMVGLGHVDSDGPGREEVFKSPFFDRDPNLCILCGRCVRVCQEVRGLGAISFAGRGHDTRVKTAFDKQLQDVGCRFCGACVDVCPTGSLAERANRWAGPPDGCVTTTCPYCSANCQMQLEVRDGRLLRSQPVGSRLCVRGRFGLEFVDHSQRLKSPLVRTNGRLVETSWEEALQAAAQGLKGIRGTKLAVLSSGRLSNEALFMLYKFSKGLPKGALAFSDPQYAINCDPALPEDLNARAVLVVGDVGAVNPALDLELRISSRSHCIVVGPLHTLLADKASIWLRPLAGRDVQVLEGMARAVIDGGLAAKEVEAARGWDKFASYLGALDILAERAGVRADDLRKAAKMLAREESVVVVPPGCPERVAQAAANLALLTGAMFCPIPRHCNSRGVEAIRMLQELGETSSALTWDRNLRPDLYGEILGTIPEKVRGAYLVGVNPVGARSDLAAHLSHLDFLVVQDLFLTETAAMADVVLPAASFAEIDGSLTGARGPLQIRRAAHPPGRARPDWWIVSRLARAMEFPGFDEDQPETVFEEMVASRTGSCLPVEPSFFVPLQEEEGVNPARDECLDGSFWLVVDESLYRFGSGTRTGKVSDLRYLTRDRVLWIHPRDASSLEIQDGDLVTVDGEGGGIQARARHSWDLTTGTLHMNSSPLVTAAMKGRAVARVKVTRNA